MRIREAKKIYSSATREDPEALHCGRRIDGMQTGIWLGFSPFSLFFFLFFVFIPLACLPAACSLPMYLHVLLGDIAPPPPSLCASLLAPTTCSDLPIVGQWVRNLERSFGCTVSTRLRYILHLSGIAVSSGTSELFPRSELDVKYAAPSKVLPRNITSQRPSSPFHGST